MVFTGSGAQPKGAYSLVQGSIAQDGLAPFGVTAARLARALAGVAALGLLGGCSSSSSMNPVNWWHGLQGGKIAEERPPPPGADAPFPNLSTVPARPTPPDRDAMRKLTDALIGDRANAQYSAEAAPLADPSSPSASPNLFGAGTLPPPPKAPPPKPPTATEPPAMSASLPAASAPPPPPSAPTPAPQRPVQSQALEAPIVPPTEAAEPPPPPVDTTPLPDLPSAPPPRAAATPPPAPVVTPIAPAPAPAGGAMIGFAPGSSSLSPTAADEVKRFLTGRVGQPIAVTGYGDATSADPGVQAAAVSLALTRAQAVVNALTAAGVPRAAITLGAEAAGRGASLRLLQ